jgi:hypothetical protein
MACPNCGSWSVRADRSLGGRMVCGRCGSPLGGSTAQGRRFRPQSRGRKQPNPALSKLPAGWWVLIALLALGAGLAWLEPPRDRQDSPQPGKGFPNQNLLSQANRSPEQPDLWQP